MIEMYRLQLHRLCGPRRPLSPERPLNLITHPLAIFSPYFLLVGLLLQYVALFQSRELVKYSITYGLILYGNCYCYLFMNK